SEGGTHMQVGIATDPGGFALKEEVLAQLRAAGHEVVDFGAHDLDPNDDYPDFVVPLARAVGAGTVDPGVDISGSGCGAHDLDPNDDYPDFVVPLPRSVVAGTVDRGVAVCGSGVGASVCANKVPGVRAALIHDHFSARQGVEDDHMNVLCMGGRTVGPSVAWDLVET